MRKDVEKLFTYAEPAEPPVGLFDRIILAIKKEKETQRARKILLSFLTLLIVSALSLPFSISMLASQAKSSGVIYFISLSFNNFGVLADSWQDAALAVLESLPILGIVLFLANAALLLFAVRLFLYKKRLLLKSLYG